METKQTFRLVSDTVRNNAKALIDSLPLPEKDQNGNFKNRPLIVQIKPETRTDEQNRKLHAMLGDIAKQCEFNGKRISLEQWKMIFVSGHAIATGNPAEVATGLEGEVINLRESTAQMGVKRLASLIEYITAWGVSNGVHFNDRYGFYGR